MAEKDNIQDVELGASSSKNPAEYSNNNNDNNPSSAEGSPKPTTIRTPTKFIIDADDEEGIDEEETAEVYRNIQKRPGTWARIIKALMGILLLSIFVLVPTAIVWGSADFKNYSITKVKIGSPLTNHYLEFVRFALFIYTAMVGFLLIELMLAMLPDFTIWSMKKLNKPASRKTRRLLSYFEASSAWFTFSAWIIFVAILGGIFLYHPNLVNTLGGGLLGKAPSSANKVINDPEPARTLSFYLERLLLAIFIFTLIYGMCKYLIELVKISFGRMAFEDRVTDLNYRFQVVTKLYAAIKNPGKRIKLERTPRDIHLLKDRYGDFSSEKKARQLASSMYSKLCPPNREYLVMDDFRNYFDSLNLQEAFSVFDRGGNGDVDREELRETIMDLYNQRLAVTKGIRNNNDIIRKLDLVFISVALFLTITFIIPIFRLSGAAVFVIFGLVWTGFGFLFQSTAKTCFESFIFVFVEHAYDVGDRVIVDNEYLTVEKVEIFTTIFRRWDGTTVYIPNSNLIGKNIYNVRRSNTQTDFIDVVFSGKTPIDKLWDLRDRLAEYARSEPKDYTGSVDISQFDPDGENIKLNLAVEYRTNFQDAALRAARRNKFMAMLKQIITEFDMEYFP